MTDVLRNVGELASPYYLLELWVREWQIDLDPETYATLKRKTQGLARDLRVFEQRSEPVDDDWRSRRLEVLGLTGAGTAAVAVDGADVAVRYAATGPTGRLLVGELDPEDDADARPADAEGGEPPATLFELALEAAPRDVAWGLLLCGLEVRIYRRGTGISQQYLELDLDGLVALNDEDLWRAFAGVFRLPAFRPGPDGVPLVQRVCDDSRAHATRLADDMRGDVVHAAETLIQGALDAPENRELLGEPPAAETLQRLFEQTLYVLYRLLFVLYAEARDVLPVREAGPYATTYSVDHLVERARIAPEAPPGTTYTAQALARLFELLESGPPEAAARLGIQVLGGELFAAGRTELFDRLLVPEPEWRRALVALAVGAPGSPRAHLGRRSSFAELGVDQLGSIYEGLLVLEPRLVTSPALLVGSGADRRVLERDLESVPRGAAELEPGAFVLESSSGRRKGSGSFYTPVEITEFLVAATLEPLTDPLVERAADGDHDGAERDLLALKVCDPAMGSGAFLVQASRVLGRALARIRALRRGGSVTPDAVKRAEAEVARRCLYGVDLNPLAVTLAKVSLWLETLQRERPLTFLDARLRTGDSLVGVDFAGADGTLSLDELATWPKPADLGLKEYLSKVAGDSGEPMTAALATRRARRGRRQATLPGLVGDEVSAAIAELAAERERLTGVSDAGGDLFQLEVDAEIRFRALERDEGGLRNRLRAAANVWCAQWFWPAEPEEFEAFHVGDDPGVVPPPGEADFRATVAHVLDPSQPLDDDQRLALDVAEAVAAERHFFHWALEFPEVVLERGGFDAVVGNPPWNTLSPDVKEFFSTYDPDGFKKNVPKARKAARQAELCEDPDIDRRWRAEALRLHELGAYAKPKAGRYHWFPAEGNLRKGDANVFRQFVERAYKLLRPGGRLGQVLPDSFYVSSPATELRRRLLDEGRLDLCFVFENRRKLFPIHASWKIVLLVAEAGAGPTDDFAAAFITGKDAAGRERAIALPELPATLAKLATSAPQLTRDQIATLAPQTLAFPELVTPLDAEIAVEVARRLPPLNLDERGWGLRYCRELDADRDAERFHTAEDLEARGAVRDGLSWSGPDGEEWWPLVEGTLFYHLEFPAEGKEPKYWVNAAEMHAIEGRRNPDGSSTMDHWRVAWRDVASATNERSAIATVLPPGCAAKDTALTVWGGSLSTPVAESLAGVMASFCFDYFVRLGGKGHLKYAAVNPIATPGTHAVATCAEIVQQVVDGDGDYWAKAELRAEIDAIVAGAYGLSLPQYAAILSSFPLLDRVEPMLPGEPKSFITRDLALLAFARRLGEESPDIVDLLEAAGIELPPPRDSYRRLDLRVAGARELGAVPYRPTPRGGRPPTDPALVADVLAALSDDPQTAETIADRVGDDESAVKRVLRDLVRDESCYASGRGRTRSYYVMEE